MTLSSFDFASGLAGRGEDARHGAERARLGSARRLAGARAQRAIARHGRRVPRIAAGRHRLIGVVTEVASNDEGGGDKRFGAVARVDLMGEIVNDAAGAERFSRGVSAYPAIGDAARIIGRDELRLVYEARARARSPSARCITTIRSPPASTSTTC